MQGGEHGEDSAVVVGGGQQLRYPTPPAISGVDAAASSQAILDVLASIRAGTAPR
jgi:hypothetical protein